MNRNRLFFVWLFLTVLVLPLPGVAQGHPPLLFIHDVPDATIDPPSVRTAVSLIDRDLAQSIPGQEGAFTLKEDGKEMDSPSVTYDSVGLAVVFVVDRGGISVPDDPRIDQVDDMVRSMVARLTFTDPPEDSNDMMAIVGIPPKEQMTSLDNWPVGDFQWPVDRNLVLNAMTKMKDERIEDTTPLYEGLDKAIELLTENGQTGMRDRLIRRRQVIIVFSDGIDPSYSNKAREEDIIRQANLADISLYTVGMAQKDQSLSSQSEANLIHLADQTDGLYSLHNNAATQQAILELFDRITTQRDQYILSYQTHQPQGTHQLEIVADTGLGTAKDESAFRSILKAPKIKIGEPIAGTPFTVPFSETLDGFETTTVTLRSEITAQDGVERFPNEVSYYADGEYIGTGYDAPDFLFVWNVSDILTPTQEVQINDFTLLASADDVYLGETITSQPISIKVTWKGRVVPVKEAFREVIRENWWIIVLLAILLIGLIVLLIMMIRTKGEVAKKIAARTTSMFKGATQLLNPAARGGPRIEIVQGANAGQRILLDRPRIVFGRDPQFCDFALQDGYVSNPHFSVQQQGNQFFMTDENSRNGTLLNGVRLHSQQRVLLQPDAIIQIGQVRLQFLVPGRVTTPVNVPPPVASPRQQGWGQPQGPGQPAAPGTGAATQIVPPPGQPAAPGTGGATQIVPPPGQPAAPGTGGATQIVPPPKQTP